MSKFNSYCECLAYFHFALVVGSAPLCCYCKVATQVMFLGFGKYALKLRV